MHVCVYVCMYACMYASLGQDCERGIGVYVCKAGCVRVERSCEMRGGGQMENLAVGDFSNAARDKPAVQI
jgi:hypothetical protein